MNLLPKIAKTEILATFCSFLKNYLEVGECRRNFAIANLKVRRRQEPLQQPDTTCSVPLQSPSNAAPTPLQRLSNPGVRSWAGVEAERKRRGSGENTEEAPRGEQP